MTGGVYGLGARDSGWPCAAAATLESFGAAFAQARRLPARGPVSFGLLVEGNAKSPLTWIALRSPQTTYAATTLQNIEGVLAFDGREAGIIDFNGDYGRMNLRARGRASLTRKNQRD